MDRRTLLTFAGGLLSVPRLLFAQPAKRVYRIAILDDADDGTREKSWATLRNRLRDVGVIEGRNAAFEIRYAHGANERLPAFAVEIAATRPDMIVTPSTTSTRAAVRATASIPIVFIGVGDPVGAGLVNSLAHPGGNVTGISIVSTETTQKTLELLR